MILVVLGAHVVVADNETTHSEALGNDLHEVTDGVLLAGLKVVLRDHTAGNNATEVVHGVDGSLELLTTDVLVVDVDTVRGEAGERVGSLLLLVVEAMVEVELLGDEFELLVVTDTSNDSKTFVLGELAN